MPVPSRSARRRWGQPCPTRQAVLDRPDPRCRPTCRGPDPAHPGSDQPECAGEQWHIHEAPGLGYSLMNYSCSTVDMLAARFGDHS
jgi:hypothetical protein